MFGKKGLLAFSLVFLFSLFWHLPASWLVKTLEVNKHLPSGWQFQQVQGLWWQGELTLNRQMGKERQAFGQIAWQWQVSALLSGQLGLKLEWRPVTNQKLNWSVLTNGETVHIQNVQGSLPIKVLAGLDPQLAILSDAAGEVFFKALSATLPVGGEIWPTALEGKLALIDFNALGMGVPQLEVIPSLKNQQVDLLLDGKGKGWRLSGHSLLSPGRFQHDLLLKAQTPEAMPDWVPLMMRPRSPTEAILKTQGRF